MFLYNIDLNIQIKCNKTINNNQYQHYLTQLTIFNLKKKFKNWYRRALTTVRGIIQRLA